MCHLVKKKASALVDIASVTVAERASINQVEGSDFQQNRLGCTYPRRILSECV